jgi:NTE family protein
MFGAYQAGVWKALAPVWQPDMVVGTSAGALNGWAIAGRCAPDELIALWMDAGMTELMRPRAWRLPLFDAEPLARLARALFQRHQPCVPYALTMVGIPRLRLKLVRGEDVTWRHLAASCAVPLGFPPVRIGRGWYVDGGLLGALPLWAAAEMGATGAIAVDALPFMPSRAIRAGARLARCFGSPPQPPAQLEITRITRNQGLGTLRDAVCWSRENARRWIDMGQEDGARLACGLTNPRAMPLK